jgi:hypothetical protein
MNCEMAREKITDSFSAGEALPPEVTLHQASCAACQNFHSKQRNLFRSMEAGLQALANEPVPTSLLPRVRARLDDAPAPRVMWKLRGNVLAPATVVVLALGAFLMLHQAQRRTAGPDSSHVVAGGDEHPVLLTPVPGHVASVPASQNRRSKVVPVSRKEASEPSLEVLVLPEERAAFARFVARLPEEEDVAMALARPAPEKEESALEIALLQIDGVEVKPLDLTTRE